jgi:bifunctional DNA-binding transcriptional regulator/antitoxin component of YhaV-PrlF toxin-antitoxin module
MSATISLDKKGRLVLPKKVREAAGISVETELLARASGAGRVELSDPEVLRTRAREIGAKKLSGWVEERHEATGYLLGSVKKSNEAH